MKYKQTLITTLCIIILLVILSYAFAAVTDNVLPAWKFDGDLTDSANSYDLTNGSLAYTPDGYINGAYTYTGSEVASTVNTDFKFSSSFSMKCWIKPSLLDNGISVIDNAYFSGGSYYGTVQSIRANGAVWIDLWDGDGSSACRFGSSATPLKVGSWSSITWVFDDTNNRVEVYHNGSLINNQSCTQAVSFSSWAGLGVGRSVSNSGTSNAFRGVIDECTIWDRNLLSTEVSSIFSSESSGSQYPWSSGPEPTQQPTVETVKLTSVLDPTFIYNSSGYFVKDTADQTPTVSVITDINSNCSISDTNSSYALCGSTGALNHTCTINTTQELISSGLDDIFINCTDATGINVTTHKYSLYIDNIEPFSSFNSPVSGFYYDKTELDLVITPTDNYQLYNIIKYINGSTVETNSTPANNTAWNTNLSGIYDINYTVVFRVTQNVSNSVERLYNNSEERWFMFIDNPPSITFNSPENQTYTNTNLTAITLSATGIDNVSLVNISYYVNGSLTDTNLAPTNNTAWEPSFTPTSNVNYTIYFEACDSHGSCTNSETRWFNFNDTFPGITFNSPVSQTYQDIKYVDISVTGFDAVQLKNMSLISNGSLIATNSTLINNTAWDYRYTVATFSNYTAYFIVCDIFDQCTTSETRWYNFIDNPPVISFDSPENQTYTNTNLSAINLVSTAYDAVGLNNLSLYINGTLNITNSSPINNTAWNTLFTPTNNVNYTAYFITCDTSGNCVTSEERWFSFYDEPPSISFDSPFNNTVFQDTKTLTLSTTASDPLRVINISLYVNDSLIQTNLTPVNNSAWTFDYTVAGFVGYEMYFKTCDEFDQCTDTAKRTFFFEDNEPVVIFNSPSSQILYSTTNVTLNVTAYDNISLVNISLYVNNTLNITNSTPINNTAWVFDLNDNSYVNYTLIFGACDNASQCTNTSERWIAFSNATNIPINYTIAGYNRSITAELGSVFNISVKIQPSYTVCVDIDHPEYGDNYNCSINSTEFPVNITYFRETLFNTNLTKKNITFNDANLYVTEEISNYSFFTPNTYLFEQYANDGNLSTNAFIGYPITYPTRYVRFRFNIPELANSAIMQFAIGNGTFTNLTVDKRELFYSRNSYGYLTFLFYPYGGPLNSTRVFSSATSNFVVTGTSIYEVRVLWGYDTINISSHQHDTAINLTFNLTGYYNVTYPVIDIYVNDTLAQQGLALGGELIQFNDSSIEKNITYSDRGIKTISYLYLPKKANVTYASMSFSGNLYDSYVKQEDANKTTSTTGAVWSPSVGNEYDGDWSTFTSNGLTDGLTYTIDHIYTPPTNATNKSLWGFRGSGTGYVNYTMGDCFNTVNVSVKAQSYRKMSQTPNAPYTYFNAWYCNLTLATISRTDCFLYEDAVWWYVTNNSLPSNLWMEAGEINGSRDWEFNYELNSTPQNVSDFSATLNAWLNVCPSDGFGNCLIPIYLYSNSSGIVTVNNINITYSFNPNPVQLLIPPIQSFLNTSSGAVDIPIYFKLISEGGTIEVSDLRYDHVGGNDTIAINLHEQNNLGIETSSITYYHSGWKLQFPNYVNYIEFIPTSTKAKNVQPYGQTFNIPIMIINATNYGGKNFNYTVLINDTSDCINDTFSLNNNKSEGMLLTGGWQDYTQNISLDSSFNIFAFADFECSYTDWYLWEPWYYFRACCEGCDVCSNSTTNLVIT